MEGSKRSQNRSRLSRMTESDFAGLPIIQRVARRFRYLFDETNPMASRTITLSLYSTWARRTFTPAEYLPSSLIVNENVIRSRIYRIYLDEGHLVKSISSLKHRATVTLETEYRWILTATPLINRKEDLLGLLQSYGEKSEPKRLWERAMTFIQSSRHMADRTAGVASR